MRWCNYTRIARRGEGERVVIAIVAAAAERLLMSGGGVRRTQKTAAMCQRREETSERRLQVSGAVAGGSGASSVASAPSNDPLRNLSILSQEAGMNAGASAVRTHFSPFPCCRLIPTIRVECETGRRERVSEGCDGERARRHRLVVISASRILA